MSSRELKTDGEMEKFEDDNITMEILVRLPSRSLMRCSCVCNRWRNLTRDPQFIQRHLNRSALENPSLILFSERDHWGKMYYLEHNGTHEYTCTDVRLPPLNYPTRVLPICSCNGLCLILYLEDPIFHCILNPITGSHLRLPKIIFPPTNTPIAFTSNSGTAFGFGFNSDTNEYKVVAVHTRKDSLQDKQSDVYVHTVGTDHGVWSCLGYVPFVIYKHSPTQALFFNGAIHWVCLSPAKTIIVSFNIANEVFQVIPHPEELSRQIYPFSLAALKGCLSITDTSSFFDRVQLWIMRDYGVEESWTKFFSINLVKVGRIICNFDQTYRLVPFRPRASNVKILCFQTNGELLMLDNDNVLQSYNPQTKEFTKLSFDTGLPYWSRAFTHVGSLVSFPGMLN